MKAVALAAVLAAMPLAAAAAGGSASAQRDYVLRCAGCHQMDGSGSAENGIPDMRGQIGHYLRTPRGRAFLVQVPGVANSPLSDRQIAAVLGWMLEKFSADEVPAGAPPYTEAEVGRLRAVRPANVPGLRQEVIAGLAAMGYPVK